MERTKSNSNAEGKKVSLNLQTLSEIIARANLATRLGLQFGGDRDLYKALGYESEMAINFDKCYGRYCRQDIAKAIIDRPVIATWQGPLELLEANTKEDTALEKAWIELDRKLGLKAILARVDRLTSIGRYGVLLLGLDDVSDQVGFEKPVKTGARKLIYVKPFSEATAKIATYEPNPKNERYGKPLLYEIKVSDVSNNKDYTVKVHYTRVVHIVQDNLESEIFGTPVLQPVYNRLMDLDKVVGGSAEMYWKGARPGYHGKVDKDYQMTQTTKDDLKTQLDEYEHGLRRFLIDEGIELKDLAPQISDPSKHVEVILKMICSETGIPMRILTGSERGELASSQDRAEWLSFVQSRRDEFAETCIVRPFVDRLIELKILPTPGKMYSVSWADLYAQSESARVEIGKARANAIREYSYNMIAQSVLPVDAFLEFCLGFTTDQIELMSTMRESEATVEAKLIPLEKEMMKGQPKEKTPAA